MNKFLMIIIGILIFPIMVVIGLVVGIINVYRAFAHSFILVTHKEDIY